VGGKASFLSFADGPAILVGMVYVQRRIWVEVDMLKWDF
jgi:hypothetical protein